MTVGSWEGGGESTLKGVEGGERVISCDWLRRRAQG